MLHVWESLTEVIKAVGSAAFLLTQQQPVQCVQTSCARHTYTCFTRHRLPWSLSDIEAYVQVHGGPVLEMGKPGSAQMPDVGHPNPKSNGTAL